MRPGKWFTLVAALGLSVPLAAQSVHYEGGVSVASGTYIFTDRTTSWTISNGLAIGFGRFTLRATVPLFVQNTTLLTGAATGPLPTGGANSGAVGDSSKSRGGQGSGSGQGTSRQVIGSFADGSMMTADNPVDVPASAATGFRQAWGDPTVYLSTSTGGRASFTMGIGVKAPFTDTTSFGTGEWDYGASVGVSRIFGRSTMLSADLSYWHLGDFPTLDLTDPIMGSVSAAYLTPTGWGASVSFAGARSVIQGFDDSYYINAGMSRLASRTAFGLSASMGLSDTTPDFTVGVTWRVELSAGGT